jgi:uncharacterized repeat protein (TIGR01451 family)
VIRPPRSLAGIAIALVSAVAITAPAVAAVLPTAGGYYIQTNGAAAAIGLGDYYTSTSGGNQDHRLSILIPCSWPEGRPIHIDLFGAELTTHAAVQGLSEELTGAPDRARFTLTGPETTPVTTDYAPTTVQEVWSRLATVPDGRAACGEWVLTNRLVNDANPALPGDDQNGWRLRVGGDDDSDPTNAAPGDADDPDGIPGTDDEIAIGLERTTFQHDLAGTACQTFWSYVAPGQASVRFHNFDMDNAGRVRYYPPGSTIDPTATTGGVAGTRSANARWNGSTGTTRVGDVVASPVAGWWAVVSCITTHNQLIQEGVNSGLLFMRQPATPRLVVTKDDDRTKIEAGGTTTYRIAIRNASDSDPSPGAARNVTVTDPLPAPLGFDSCRVVAPASGTCTESGGTVTATIDGAINAGGSAEVEVTASIPPSAPAGDVVNTASVAYEDSYGNTFVPVQAQDTSMIIRTADVAVDIALLDTAYAGQPNRLRIIASNLGVEDAASTELAGVLPTGFAPASFDAPPAWSCSFTATTYSCLRTGALIPGAEESIDLLGTLTAGPDEDLLFPVTITTATQETRTDNNDDQVSTTTVPYPADVTVTVTLDGAPETDEPARFLVDVGSEGLDDAADTSVTGPLPTGFAVVSIEAPAGWTCTIALTDWTCTRQDPLPTGTTERLELLGTVTAPGGEPVRADASVTTTTLELNLDDNTSSDEDLARALQLSAAPLCERDVPWLTLDTAVLGFAPAPGTTATVVWRTLGGTVVQTDQDVPLAQARLLWPGAAVDDDGVGIAWPGWERQGDLWAEVPDERDGTLVVEVSVNPTATTMVTYPEATSLCAATPRVDSAGGGSQAPAPAPAPGTSPAPAADESDPPAGTAASALPDTGGDAVPMAVLGLAFLLIGAALRKVTAGHHA